MTQPDPASDTSTKAPGPSGRWVRVALAISLAINLAVAGVVAGAMLRGGPMHGGMMTQEAGFAPLTEALSKDDRARLRRALLIKAPDMRDRWRATRADLNELLVQLRAVPLDVESLRAVLARQNTRSSERRQLGQDVIVDLVVGMTEDERQTFAARLEQNLARGPKRQNGGGTP